LVKLKDDAEREEEFVRILQVIRKHMEGAPRPAAQASAPYRAAASSEPGELNPEEAEASEDETYEEAEAAQVDEEAPPLEVALGADLEAMLADPRAQALTIQAAMDDGGVELMLVTEGRDGTVLIEVLGNDELPPDFKMSRDAQRLLVEELGFNPPEIRGDRFWSIHGADGEDIDLVQVTDLIAAVLAGVFNVPGEDAAVLWQILEQ
jgi:hypothetical protein